MPITARMAIIALIFETVVGIFLGMLAGLRKDKFIDNFVRVSTVLLIAFPVFVFGVAGAAVRRPEVRPLPPK